MTVTFSLLPMKSDLNHISGWRRLKIFNSDYRLYSKMVNERLKLVAADIIDPAWVGLCKADSLVEISLGHLT